MERVAAGATGRVCARSCVDGPARFALVDEGEAVVAAVLDVALVAQPLVPG